jgi:CheY-like chemotaxis protein
MKTILVVEDDVDIRETVVSALSEEGYQVESAANGRLGLEKLETIAEPCLVLLDFMMPEMNGAEVLRELREGHRVAALPVVVVSAYALTDAQAEGARRSVRKPISLDLLLHVVREFCGSP